MDAQAFRNAELVRGIPALREAYREAEAAAEEYRVKLRALEREIGSADRAREKVTSSDSVVKTAEEVADILQDKSVVRREASQRLGTVKRLRTRAKEKEKQSDDAAWMLAEVLLETGESTSEAVDLLNLLANREDTRAIMQFAELFRRGRIYDKDPAKALSCLKWAYELGDPGASFELGRFYRLGIGTEPDRRKARAYFEKAARAGDGEAEFQLAAICFEEGREREGAEYLLHCIGRDIPGARYQYALCLLYGTGVDRDEPRALRLLEECAADGDEEAAARLDYLREIT